MTRLRNAIPIAISAALCMLIAMSPSASGAIFHTSEQSILITALPDGTGKTAHQVFDIAGWPITCGGMEAQGAAAGTTFTQWTAEGVTYLPVSNGACTLGGSPVIAAPKMNGCDYLFSASGQIDIQCPPEKTIHYFGIPGCELTIPAQTNSKASYHNIEVSGVKAITMEISISNLSYFSAGIECGASPGLHSDGKYTTGNVILSAERPGTGEPVPLWIE